MSFGKKRRYDQHSSPDIIIIIIETGNRLCTTPRIPKGGKTFLILIYSTRTQIVNLFQLTLIADKKQKTLKLLFCLPFLLDFNQLRGIIQLFYSLSASRSVPVDQNIVCNEKWNCRTRSSSSIHELMSLQNRKLIVLRQSCAASPDNQISIRTHRPLEGKNIV